MATASRHAPERRSLPSRLSLRAARAFDRVLERGLALPRIAGRRPTAIGHEERYTTRNSTVSTTPMVIQPVL